MEHLSNTPALAEKVIDALTDTPWPSDDASRPMALLLRCPVAAQTPLVNADTLAKRCNVVSIHIKDERGRMGLGSFKALGAAYVIAQDAEQGKAKGQTYITASAGNHGLSVAAGAGAFGATAIIYIAETVPETFAERLRSIGATVRREGAVYEDSMAAAAHAAETGEAVLLSDSSWTDYYDRPHTLMEGYLVLMAETVQQIPTPPTHIFLQAGVGGLATACAAYARKIWGDAPRIIVVEPDVAPALYASIRAGQSTVTDGPASAMGRLDCKEPSLIALKGLARDTNDFLLISEDEGAHGSDVSADIGLASTPSGAAGLAALVSASQSNVDLDLSANARVFAILSEEA